MPKGERYDVGEHCTESLVTSEAASKNGVQSPGHKAMPVSGLVIVLSDPNTDAIAAIRANARFVIGDGPVNGRLPVVLDTKTEAEDRAQMRWLEALPGVALVEVAYHDFSDASAARPDDGAGDPGWSDSEGANR